MLIPPNVSGPSSPLAKGSATKLPLLCSVLNGKGIGEVGGNASGAGLRGLNKSMLGAPPAKGSATKLPLDANTDPPGLPPVPGAPGVLKGSGIPAAAPAMLPCDTVPVGGTPEYGSYPGGLLY